MTTLRPYSESISSDNYPAEDTPRHWVAAPLKHWVRFNPEVLPESSSPELLLDYLDIGSVSTGRLVRKPEQLRFADAPSRARRIVRAGDAVIATVRTYLKAVYSFTDDHDGLVVSTGFAVLRPGSAVNADFLKYLIQEEKFVDEVVARSVGVAYPAITEPELGRIPITLPPLDEQIAIANFLDAMDERIDRYIAARRKMIALLEEKKQAIINQAVTRGPDPTVPLKPSGIDWLGDVPAHWEVTRFKKAVGFQEGPGIMATDFREDGVPLLRISCLRGKVATLDGCNYLDPEMVERRWGHFRIRATDYIISASGNTSSISRANSLVEGAIPYTGIIRLWPIGPGVSMDYIEVFVQSALFHSQVAMYKSGVAIEHYGPTHLNRMWLVLPPKEEQESLSQHVKDENSRIDHMIHRVESEISLVQEYRTRLVSDVVTGKLDVREFDLPKLEDDLLDGLELIPAEVIAEDEQVGDPVDPSVES